MKGKVATFLTRFCLASSRVLLSIEFSVSAALNSLRNFKLVIMSFPDHLSSTVRKSQAHQIFLINMIFDAYCWTLSGISIMPPQVKKPNS